MAAHRRRSGDRGGGRNGANKRTSTQKRDLETRSVRTESSSERDTNISEKADQSDLRAQRGSRKARGGRRGPRNNRGPGFRAHGWHERLLWDELRDSLASVAGSEPVMRTKWSDGGGGVVEQATGDRASKEQQRQLIDEAIAVLLEGSSSDEGEMETN